MKVAIHILGGIPEWGRSYMNKVSLSLLVRLLIKYIPYLSIIASLIVYLILIFIIKRVDLVIKSSIILLPLIISSLLLLFLAKRNKQIVYYLRDISAENSVSSRMLQKIYVILLCFTVSLFAYSQKQDLLFILLVSCLYLTILFQIFLKNKHFPSILLQLLVTTLLLIWSMIISYPLYFGTTDILINANWVELVGITGFRLPEVLIEDYNNFPLLSIAGAMINSITNLDSYTSLYIYCTVPLIIASIFVYYLTKSLTKSNTIGLLSSFLYLCLPSIPKYSSEAMACVMATFVFITYLYLLFRDNALISPNRKLMLTLILIVYLTLVHHVSVPLIFIIMLVFIVCSYMLGYHTFRNQKWMYLILFILPIGYWTFTFLNESISILNLKFFGGIERSSEQMLNLGVSQTSFDVGYVINNVSSLVIVLLCMLAIYVVLKYDDNTYHILSVFALLALSLILFFVPGIIDISTLLSDNLRIVRWRLLMTPIFAVIMGVGCVIFINILSSKINRNIAVGILLFILLLTIVCSTIVYITSNSDVFTDDKINKHKYITETELNTYSHVENYIKNGATILSDWITKRYLYSTIISDSYNHSSYETPYDQTIYSLFNDDKFKIISPAYVIFCGDRYYNRLYTGYLPGAASPVVIDVTDSHTNTFTKNMHVENVIFDNEDCRIYSI